MATRLLTRSLLASTKQTLDSIFTRSFSSFSLPKPQAASPPILSLLRFRPLVAVTASLRDVLSPSGSVRRFATRHTTSSLNDPNPNWSNRPPKETILLEGCDFEHWLVVVEKPDENMTRDDIIDSYIKLLAQVVGSEEEARMKIYSVSTKHYFAFGALVSEELSYKMKELPGVRWVLPDSYLDVRNKDYGGEPFINGQAVPYDPKYHAEWVKNNARANERNRRNVRPRNHDRSGNFERRREMDMNRQNVQNTGGQTFPGGPQNTGPNNLGYVPPNNMGGGMHTNPQYVDAQHSRGAPYQSGPEPRQNSYVSNTSGGHPYQNNNLGGMPMPNHPSNPQHGYPSNSGGAPYQSGLGSNPSMAGGNPYHNNHMAAMPNNAPYNGAPTYQSVPAPNSNSYAQNTGGGNHYQNQNMPGRDVPPPQNY